MTGDLSVKMLRSLCLNIGQKLHVKIHYLMAAGAYKMIMGSGGGIKPVRSVSCADFLDASQIYQEGQVPIDRAKADIRINLTDVMIYHIRSRMIAAVH